MERAIEWYLAVTGVVVGLSHIVQARAWMEFFGMLHRLGRPGAFINGGMSLVPGAVIVAGHPDWSWPGAPITVLGWLMVVKGAISFLVPDLALRSMERAPSRAGFVAAVRASRRVRAGIAPGRKTGGRLAWCRNPGKEASSGS